MKVGGRMKVEKMNKDRAEEMKKLISPGLLTHPHFMFYCPAKSRRADFIDDFLSYHLFNWTDKGQLYVSPNVKIIASLVGKKEFEYKFSGRNSFKLKMNKNASRIFVQRKNVDHITRIIVPDKIDARVLTLYGKASGAEEDLRSLICEMEAIAKKEGFAIVYETFSRRLVAFMESMGFEVAYQKPFLGTQFYQTLMIYNINSK